MASTRRRIASAPTIPPPGFAESSLGRHEGTGAPCPSRPCARARPGTAASSSSSKARGLEPATRPAPRSPGTFPALRAGDPDESSSVVVFDARERQPSHPPEQLAKVPRGTRPGVEETSDHERVLPAGRVEVTVESIDEVRPHLWTLLAGSNDGPRRLIPARCRRKAPRT